MPPILKKNLAFSKKSLAALPQWPDPDCTNHFNKSDWGHSAIFKMTTEDFLVLLALSDSMLPLE
jgi:hypothetical protein